ncbi:hypothetical protein ES703_81352 [subsurface metagenome]
MSRKLYIPPPERSLPALRLLGVELKGVPPKNWHQYEDLLLSRLNRLSKDQRSRAGLVNELQNDALLNEDPGDKLLEFLLASERYSENHYVVQSLFYLSAKPPQKQKLLANAQKDPQLAKLNENQRLNELRSVSLWEWWDLLR